MLETTAESAVLKKFNPSRLPPEGSEWVGQYFNTLWEAARKEKIGRLGLHQRFLDLQAAYRGKKRKRTYPRIGANYLFKIMESHCAALTEKVPIADINADDADDPLQVKAFQSESEEWWTDTEQQFLLHSSTLNMQIYGTTLEKGILNIETGEPEIVLVDPFNGFPAPGFKMCNMALPYFCEVDFLADWEIRGQFGLPESVIIPADADEQLAGTIRQTVRGGSPESDTSTHYPTNYAPIPEQTISESLKEKTMVVEIWVRDNATKKEPIMEEREVARDDLGRPIMQKVETEEVNEIPIYPDGIRKVVICPALIQNMEVRGVLDDAVNPNINWGLLQARAEFLVKNGVPVEKKDAAGQPVVDPETGQVAIELQPVEPEKALPAMYARAKISYPLWGKFPYSATPSRVDTSQWWGFSTEEQLEEMQGKAEMMTTKYFIALERQMFPILLLPVGCGVEKEQVSNDPGLVLNPTIPGAPMIKYLEPPQPPREYLEAIEFIMRQMDIVAMSPDVSEGRKPKGITAASAIIALQDKAETLFSPQKRQVDRLIRNRGRMYIHFKMNFDTTRKQVKVDDEFVNFRGIDIFSAFKYNVESGSSAPITKAGRRQQFVELRKMGDMDRQSLLDFLDIPQAKLINERLTEIESVPGALKILVEAGLPIEDAQMLFGFLMKDQFAPKPKGGTTMKTPEEAAPRAGGISEGMTSANRQMSDLKEG